MIVVDGDETAANSPTYFTPPPKYKRPISFWRHDRLGRELAIKVSLKFIDHMQIGRKVYVIIYKWARTMAIEYSKE